MILLSSQDYIQMVINYIKESTQEHSVFMNMKEGVEGGKLRGSYLGKEAGGNPG